jgi:hypothetical protein
MKTLFLLLKLLTEWDAIRDALYSCYVLGAVGVAVLFFLMAYQLLRRSDRYGT